MTFKPVIEPGDLQDFPAVGVEAGEHQAAVALFAEAQGLEQGLEPDAGHKMGGFEVDDDVGPLSAVYENLAQGGGLRRTEVAFNGDDGHAVIFVAGDGHVLFIDQIAVRLAFGLGPIKGEGRDEDGG
ncbi:MAG: hypothetical protein JWL69_5172 [Phycisphaerales bacterium]|nr:hypothetical protein [Phycisphaerales bacterium]MDB5355332.1 hypothetical protein [Phycisphaerales bacterium]